MNRSRRAWRVSAVFLCLLIVPVMLVRGDHVVLENGELYRGKILRQDAATIVIRTEFSEVTIRKSDVRSVDYDTAPERWESLWRSALLPGWGQFWHDRPGFGVTYSVLTAAALTTTLITYARFTDARDKYYRNSADMSLFRIADDRRRIFNTAALLTAGLWLWQAADAMLFAPEGSSRIMLAPVPEAGTFGMQMGLRF